MDNSNTSDKIQQTLEKKGKKRRLTEEKGQLVKNIREKYRSLVHREKQAKELTNKLFEPIVTPLKSLTKNEPNIDSCVKIKKEHAKEKFDE